MRREDYVRPPVVALEPPSQLIARWRYRLIAVALLLLTLAVLLWLFVRFSGVTNGEDPGLGGALRQAVIPATGR